MFFYWVTKFIVIIPTIQKLYNVIASILFPFGTPFVFMMYVIIRVMIKNITIL